jgi:hypothetical protein
MEAKHKQVVTTSPVAIKYGQGRVHVANPIPWHARSEVFQCPDCETLYIVTEGFPRSQFLEALKNQHREKAAHPDCIFSEANWTRIEDCNCGA